MTITATDGDEIMTAIEVAGLFGVSVRSVRTWVKDGKLRAYRVAGSNGVQRFLRSDALALMTDWRD